MENISVETTIYHNPRCSKSRQTLKLLETNDVTPVVIEYLKTPPDTDTLRSILSILGLSPRELIRTRENEYTELELANPALDDEELIQAMISHPILIERPIVITGNKAAIGRPPEAVLEIIK